MLPNFVYDDEDTIQLAEVSHAFLQTYKKFATIVRPGVGITSGGALWNGSGVIWGKEIKAKFVECGDGEPWKGAGDGTVLCSHLENAYEDNRLEVARLGFLNI